MTTNSCFLFQKTDGFVRKYGVPPNSVINHHVPLRNVIWRVYITSFSDKTQLDNIYIYVYMYAIMVNLVTKRLVILAPIKSESWQNGHFVAVLASKIASPSKFQSLETLVSSSDMDLPQNHGVPSLMDDFPSYKPASCCEIFQGRPCLMTPEGILNPIIWLYIHL